MSDIAIINGVKANYRHEKLIPPEPDWPHYLQKTLTYINTNIYEQDLNISLLKEKYKINGQAFSSVFKLYIGNTPKKYIINNRLETGKILLEYDHITITLVGLSVGFSSLSSFCHTFKKRFKLTPTQWRQENI